MTNDTMRRQIGRRLLACSLQVLPEWSWEKKALIESLNGQREYDRYCAMTLLLGAHALPFAVWREDWSAAHRFAGRKVSQAEINLETKIGKGLSRQRVVEEDNELSRKTVAAKLLIVERQAVCR